MSTTSLLFLAACGTTTNLISARIDEDMGTIVHVDWETTEQTDGWVEYGPTEAYGHTTPIVTGQLHEATLLGIPAGATWHYRVVDQAGGVTSRSEDDTVTTDPLPDSLPEMTLSGAPASTGYTAFTWWSVADWEGFAAIADENGQIVWYKEAEQDFYQAARFSQDNGALLVLNVSLGLDENASIVRVPLDGTETEAVATPYAHHDFLEQPGGGYWYIAGQTSTHNGEEIVGDAISEARDGQTSMLWSAFDHLPIVENDGFGQSPIDWTHANGIDYDEVSDAWTLSLYQDRQVVNISRETGNILWFLGGDRSAFQFGDDPGFGPQHSPRWVDGNLQLFDNAYDGSSSRIVAYDLDDSVTPPQATVAWSWQPEQPVDTVVLGDALVLPDGGLVSAWGERNELRWSGADGELRATLYVEGAGLLGRVDHTDSLYPTDAVFPEG